VVSLAERRRCVTWLRNEHGVSERRACQAMQMNRSSYRYVGVQEPMDERYVRVVSLSRQYPCWGYRKIYDLMRAEGVRISRERVRLIRRREGLQVVRKRRKRKVLGTTTQWVHRACYPNHVWGYDFVFDQTDDARQLKCLTVVDEFTRHGLTIDVGRSLTAGDVIRSLERLFRLHGRPACLRSDNGPELVSTAVQAWLKDNQVDTHYIDPGSPWQNAYSESFNSIFRTTCLDRWLFSSLTEARVVINQWLEEYNTVRPHGSLGGMNPEQFLQQWTQGNMIQQPKSLTL
jgi:putative transposase